METKSKIRAFIGKFMDINKVTDQDNIFEKGLVSSLFAMQLVTFAEKEFEIGFDDDDLDIENFKSIESIACLVNAKS